MERRKDALVAENFCGYGKCVVWNFSFRRNLNDIENFDFAALLDIFNKVNVSVGRDDERLWKLAVKG